MRILLTGGRVIDGTDGSVKTGMDVLIDAGKVHSVGPQGSYGNDVKTVDVSGKTVMPGLIDCHVHFNGFFSWLIRYQEERLMLMAARTAWSLERMLRNGVTSARDLGGLDAGFVQAVELGLIPGPRVQTSVLVIQPTNGLMDNLPGVGFATSPQGHYADYPGLPAPYCDSPWAARAKVREVLRAGADVIKIASCGCTAMRQFSNDHAAFTFEELEAIIDEAHRVGVKVTSHALGGQGLKDPIDAGIDGIEHGSGADDAAIGAMAARGVYLCPTLWIMKWHAINNPLPEVREMMAKEFEAAKGMLKRAHSAGVPIIMGTDSGLHDPVGNAAVQELQYMVEAGMSPEEVIVASTRRGAEAMGIDQKVGTLEAGKAADLLVVDGDPISDITVLQDEKRFLLVVKGGEPVGGSGLANGWNATKY